jgi:esterase/lipase superfamily enzyme
MSIETLRRRAARLCLLAFVLPILSACASTGKLTINLMPAPEALVKGLLRGATTDQRPVDELPGGGMLYVTDRAPSQTAGGSFYESVRGGALRAGEAKVAVGNPDLTWDEMRREAHLRRKGEDLSLRVTGVEEFGLLETPRPPGAPPVDAPSGPAARRFAEEINARLAKSPEKDVFIFIHGFRVNFENPVLVGAELWHFLGYQGAFIAYSWPATPKVTAYVGDIETAMATARNLRELVAFIETSTNAERIHIIAHSAGTRLAARAMDQIALINRHDPGARQRIGRKIENVVLLSSDIDRDAFAASIADGLLAAQRHLVIYGSGKDSALRASRALTGHQRLGSMFGAADLSDQMTGLFRNNPDRVSYIDVTGVEGFDSGLGHSYFRSSPWVSSDLLMKLAYRLYPEERGLVRDTTTGILSFPPDYIERMTAIYAARRGVSAGRKAAGVPIPPPIPPGPAAVAGTPPAAR